MTIHMSRAQLDLLTPQELFVLRLAVERVAASTEALIDLCQALAEGITFQEGQPATRDDNDYSRDCDGPPIW
jgi:hypothetical protein